MKIAEKWLTKVYPYYWYYTHDSEGRVASARLLKRESSIQISELSITVIDRRAEYYDKILMRGSQGGKTDSKPVE